MKNTTVLLTGISGYIGLHTAKQLLDEGFTVRGSVRNMRKADDVKATLKAASVDTTNLSFVALNLTSDDGWHEALNGCDYVIHMASPYVVAEPKNENELIAPAVEGSLRALRAAKRAGVKRVVLTSSTFSMMASMKTGTFGPDDWSDTDASDVSAYAKSKAIAEKEAWNFINNQSDNDKMEMVSVNPGGVFGPPLGNNITGQSMTMIDQMLRGKVPMVANVSLPMVDVRDVAKLHVQAMLHANASGKRIVASVAEPIALKEIAKILQEKGFKGPSVRVAPNFMIRLMSLFDREAKGMVGLLGMKLHADNSETRTLFNWEPIPFSKSVLDSATAVKRITSG